MTVTNVTNWSHIRCDWSVSVWKSGSERLLGSESRILQLCFRFRLGKHFSNSRGLLFNLAHIFFNKQPKSGALFWKNPGNTKKQENLAQKTWHEWKLGFWNISKHPGRYGIQMDPSVTERSRQSGKKPALCTWGLVSTITRGREPSDQESVSNGKITLAREHNWAPITSTSARGVARTSARRPRPSDPGWEFFRIPGSLLNHRQKG